MATDDELNDAIQAEIEANPAGVTEDENQGRRTQRAGINELIAAQGKLAARSARARGGLFARLIGRRPS
ncbi:MAG: hypothetical protein AAGI54_00780 [Planctomycetota bacterium]